MDQISRLHLLGALDALAKKGDTVPMRVVAPFPIHLAAIVCRYVKVCDLIQDFDAADTANDAKLGNVLHGDVPYVSLLTHTTRPPGPQRAS
jgi:hypothetical protein